MSEQPQLCLSDRIRAEAYVTSRAGQMDVLLAYAEEVDGLVDECERLRSELVDWRAFKSAKDLDRHW